MASLFHDPLDSQAPPPCTLKSAPLAKIKPLGNTGAHKCSREAPSFQAAFAAYAHQNKETEIKKKLLSDDVKKI